MTEKDFKLVIDVHLNGAYAVTKAAWPYFQKQKFGRVVNTSSPAGLYGFAETLAKEGDRYNIKANAIAPLARSRMTESILPPPILENWVSKRWERSGGVLFKPDQSFTAEVVAKRFSEVLNFDDSGKPEYLKNQHPFMLNDYTTLTTEARKLPSNDASGAPKVTLKDKVVLITGAGAGLGKEYAKWFARYGAKVVVNDFKDATKTVEEIKAAGGEAWADQHDVASQAEEIIKNVIDKYGTSMFWSIMSVF
ncbi:short chain dehydrogenase family protein [Candida albicans]|nr:short chain dehydrogenase family protein [Candida albicans]